jgi:hypothetical protein
MVASGRLLPDAGRQARSVTSSVGPHAAAHSTVRRNAPWTMPLTEESIATARES